MDNPTSIGHQPDGKWQFDDTVTHVFDDMLERSIPNYETMRQAVIDLAVKYAIAPSTIVDLGCSRGENIARLLNILPKDTQFLGIDVSKPMLQAAKERFTTEIETGQIRVESFDLRQGYPQVKDVSVTLAVLTLQFTPMEYRQQIIRNIYKSTRRGGCLILVEKVIGASADLDNCMVNLYYALKGQNGYSQDEIQRKRLSLEGVLVPVTARWNEELLGGAGFRQVDCFWRWMNFAGWVAVKGD
ncbi:MAG: methyltransferase domain-containing protein [Leptolyngbyaceae cyanobacterium bins.302]|nr:methyltransferase domain-containing protein [Leptolyngbyaceae cyanobacterium bins.302]